MFFCLFLFIVCLLLFLSVWFLFYILLLRITSGVLEHKWRASLPIDYIKLQ